MIMTKVKLETVLRVLTLALALTAASCMTARAKPAPDQGKNLTRAPNPITAGTPGECNRDCLYAFVDKYFAAMLSRCPCNASLAQDVKYTEDGQLVKPGEGIWKTFSGRGTYRVYLADPSTGQVGYYGSFTEFGGQLFGMMAMRLKVKGRQITEAEVIIARQELRPKGGLGMNTAGVMTPRLIDEVDPEGFVSPGVALLAPLSKPETRDQLIAATSRYFEGFAQSKGSVTPFDAQCSRRENGIMATNNADGPVVDPAQPAFHLFSQGCAQETDRGFFSTLFKVRGTRQLVVDERQGLVLDLSFYDNGGSTKSVSVAGVGNVAVPSNFLRPISFMKPQLFKIENGNIRVIEGLSWPVPFGMGSGWDQ
jgi:hypothetical protein